MYSNNVLLYDNNCCTRFKETASNIVISHLNVFYLTKGSSILDTEQAVGAVQSGTVHAHWPLIQLTEQIQRLEMDWASKVTRFGGASPVGLPHKSLTGVFQVAIGHCLLISERLSADGTLLVDLPAPLQTAPAEGVGARQEHGVIEDALTHGTGQVLSQGLRSLVFHFHVHAVKRITSD